MDFVSDQLFDGSRFRALTLVEPVVRERIWPYPPEPQIRGIDVVAMLPQNQIWIQGEPH